MAWRGLVELREGIGCWESWGSGELVASWHAGRSVTLKAVGPAAGGVVDARNLDFCPKHAVRNNVGRFGYHQFARAGDIERPLCSTLRAPSCSDPYCAKHSPSL